MTRSAEIALVTGATGLLGRRLVECLVERGQRVRALVRPASDAVPLRKLEIDIVPGDLEDAPSLARAVEGVSVVYHCAALVTDWSPRQAFVRANAIGTQNLVNAALGARRIRRFIHVSSTDVYGYPEVACDEDHPMVRVGLAYNETKILAEEFVRQGIASADLPAVILRPATIYGPRAWSTVGAIAEVLERGPMVVIGDGSTDAGLVYVDDVVGALLAASDADIAVGRAYNLRAPESVTWSRYISALASHIGVNHGATAVPRTLAALIATAGETLCSALPRRPKPLLTRHALLLMSRDQAFPAGRAERELAWTPAVRFDDGITRAAEWWRSLGETRTRKPETRVAHGRS